MLRFLLALFCALAFPSGARGLALVAPPRSASFIDGVAKYEREADRDMNANLGLAALLYQDDDLLVYSKPNNAQTTPGFVEQDSLSSRIAERFNLTAHERDQMVVHRLDYATSGVVVFARNKDALTNLHSQFRLKKTYKRYTALVHGVFADSLEGDIDLPLARDWERKPLNKVDVSERGKPSQTEWRVVARDAQRGVSLLHLRPLTGRTHQLRVHMAALGHPILGDLFYGSEEIYLSARRLCLHAEELRLLHPRTRIPMRFFDPCPFSLSDY